MLTKGKISEEFRRTTAGTAADSLNRNIFFVVSSMSSNRLRMSASGILKTWPGLPRPFETMCKGIVNSLVCTEQNLFRQKSFRQYANNELPISDLSSLRNANFG